MTDLRSAEAGVRGKPGTGVTLRPEQFDATSADSHPDAGAESHPNEPHTGAVLHRIVVVGGGAAGLELVTRLGDRLGRRRRASVTLVENARTHLWKPLIHEVAACSMDPGENEMNYLAQAHWHGFRYRFGEMIGIDRAAKACARSPSCRSRALRRAQPGEEPNNGYDHTPENDDDQSDHGTPQGL
jgi:hypothetical protein